MKFKKPIVKTVGIIGGLGPETTAEFYLDVVFSCMKKDKTNRPINIDDQDFNQIEEKLIQNIIFSHYVLIPESGFSHFPSIL